METKLDKEKIIIADINIPFWKLVMLLVDIAVASVPAAIIFFFLFASIGALLGGLL
jgi:hypothetical protein